MIEQMNMRPTPVPIHLHFGVRPVEQGYITSFSSLGRKKADRQFEAFFNEAGSEFACLKQSEVIAILKEQIELRVAQMLTALFPHTPADESGPSVDLHIPMTKAMEDAARFGAGWIMVDGQGNERHVSPSEIRTWLDHLDATKQEDRAG